MTRTEKALVKAIRLVVKDELKAMQQTPKRKRPWQNKATLRKMRNQGFSDEAIGRNLGCSQHTINKWRHHFKIHTSLSSRKWNR